MICINCNYQHDEKFCPNCGEKANVPKITLRSILQDSFLRITSMDKGFLFNAKNLFLVPQKIVTDYLLGRRKGIFNPVSYLIISVSIYLIVDAIIGTSAERKEVATQAYTAGYAVGIFISNHFKYFWILSVIWLSISTRLIFGKYNFAEHLAINSFVIGQTTLVSLVGFLIFKMIVLFNPITYILITWLTYKIFVDDNKLFSLFKSIVTTFLFLIQLGLVAIGISIIQNYT